MFRFDKIPIVLQFLPRFCSLSVLTGFVILSATGCNKEAATASGSTGASQQPAAATQAQQPTAQMQGAPPPKNPGDPDLGELNRDLRRWILANRRPPKSFEDFASTANAQIPPPPAGKKYAIDKTMHVILVKQ